MSKHSVLAAVVTLKEMLVDRGLELGDLVGVERGSRCSHIFSRYIRLAIRQKISYSS
jgi:hypothetical protein